MRRLTLLAVVLLSTACGDTTEPDPVGTSGGYDFDLYSGFGDIYEDLALSETCVDAPDVACTPPGSNMYSVLDVAISGSGEDRTATGTLTFIHLANQQWVDWEANENEGAYTFATNGDGVAYCAAVYTVNAPVVTEDLACSSCDYGIRANADASASMTRQSTEADCPQIVVDEKYPSTMNGAWDIQLSTPALYKGAGTGAGGEYTAPDLANLEASETAATFTLDLFCDFLPYSCES